MVNDEWFVTVIHSASGLKTHWKTSNCMSAESVVEYTHIFETASHEANFHETDEFKMDTGMLNLITSNLITDILSL